MPSTFSISERWQERYYDNQMHRITLTLTATILLFVACSPIKIPVLRERAKKEQERITKETQEAIKSSQKLQELDRLCTKDIPLPPDFVLVKLHRDYKDETFLGYGYHSDVSYQQVKTLYRDYFLQRGWQLAGEKDRTWGYPYIEFINATYRIKIYDFGPGDGVNYSFHCEKLGVAASN